VPVSLVKLTVILLAVWSALATVAAVRWYGVARDREAAAAELRTRLARTQLQVLKGQIQPHFLFNILNTVAELVHTDPDVADRTLTRLGHLLRLSLDRHGRQLVSLAEEVELLRAYVEIEQVRFGDRLAVTWDVAPEALDAAVPTLLCQPVVENAIRHGLTPRGGGRVTVRARREDEDLVVEVRDDGRGLPPGGVPVGPGVREGVGVRNVRARLAQLYGDRAAFSLHNAPEGGAAAVVRLPFSAWWAARTPAPIPLAEGAEPAR
jgi:two-component system LytT family sensor kinase